MSFSSVKVLPLCPHVAKERSPAILSLEYVAKPEQNSWIPAIIPTWWPSLAGYPKAGFSCYIRWLCNENTMPAHSLQNGDNQVSSSSLLQIHKQKLLFNPCNSLHKSNPPMVKKKKNSDCLLWHWTLNLFLYPSLCSLCYKMLYYHRLLKQALSDRTSIGGWGRATWT